MRPSLYRQIDKDNQVLQVVYVESQVLSPSQGRHFSYLGNGKQAGASWDNSGVGNVFIVSTSHKYAHLKHPLIKAYISDMHIMGNDTGFA